VTFAVISQWRLADLATKSGKNNTQKREEKRDCVWTWPVDMLAVVCFRMFNSYVIRKAFLKTRCLISITGHRIVEHPNFRYSLLYATVVTTNCLSTLYMESGISSHSSRTFVGNVKSVLSK
jgi:hypothetical protein